MVNEPANNGARVASGPSPPAPRSYNIYYVYADADEDYLRALERHLGLLERQELARGWHRRKVLPGEDWQTAVDQHFESADIIVLLVSPDLLDSKYCYDTEVERAMSRHRKGEALVVPVIVRPCMWKLAPFEKCQPLPSNAKPVSSWEEPESAFLDIAQGIHDLLRGLRKAPERTGRRAAPSQPTADRYRIRECVDQLEDLLAELPEVPGDLARANELRAEIGALDQSIRPLLTPKAGDLMGGMELLHPIGSGAFATVWLSKKPVVDTDERFATKVLHATCLTSGSMLWRFRRGVKAMKYLTKKKDAHPHIVPLLQEDESSLAFTMPFLPGQNLVNVKERGWSVERKVQVVVSICRAVEYAHRQGVVHRDIKPANIVFDEAGAPVLTDFDIADMDYATTASMDERGLGSPMFAAPEQLENSEKSDVRFDVYSIGRLLHYLLMERPISVTPEHPADFEGLSKLPMPLCSIVRRATRRKPSRRYRDVASLRAALEVYRSPWSTFSAWVDTIGDRLRPWLMLLAVFLLGALTAASCAHYERQYRALRADLAQISGDLAHMGATFDELLREKGSYADEKKELQGKMEALVDKYNEYTQDRAIAPADRNILNAKILEDWLVLKAKFDQTSEKEAALAEKIQKEKTELDETKKRLEGAQKRLAQTAPFWRKSDAPSQAPLEPEPTQKLQGPSPDWERSSLPEPPKPLTFTDMEPRLQRAAEQATRACAAPAGAQKSVKVDVTVRPSGRVSVVMARGPQGTGAELCVLAAFQAIRVEPFKGSELSVSRNFVLKGEK